MSKGRLSKKLTPVAMEAEKAVIWCLGTGEPEMPSHRSIPVSRLRTVGGWGECKSQAGFKGPTVGALVFKSRRDAGGSLSKTTQALLRWDEE